ncbi:MAG: ABC-type transporter, integral rane subunit [Gemmatimonadetes bacterium]|nr:ABC-type transporter, integral rane subunit [Gemmatimonadota bacterium]
MSSIGPSSRSIVGRLLAHRSARWALAVIALLVVAAIAGPWFTAHAGHEQLDIVKLKNTPPSWRYPFGTDQYSRDLLTRVLLGARISLAVATLAVLLSTTLGTAYGLISGYAGGAVDAAMMRVLDGFLSIPRVLLLIAILTLWNPVPLSGLILLLGATGWFGVSRIVRAQTLATRHLEYVESARALGAGTGRILLRHVLPNIVTPVIVTATLAVGNVIALEAGLSYLGVGAREPTPSWGSIFFDGVEFFAGNWWVVFFPGVAIVATVLAFNVLGDALRDVLDPRQLHRSAPVTPGTQPRENG